MSECEQVAAKCNIGKEILDGIREIKRGEHGRVTSWIHVAKEFRPLSTRDSGERALGTTAFRTRIRIMNVNDEMRPLLRTILQRRVRPRHANTSPAARKV